MGTILQRTWFGSLGLLGLVSAGCLEIPYLAPEASVVAPFDSGCPVSEVRAFRVDTTCVDHIHSTGLCFGGIYRAEAHVSELAQITLTERGEAPAQAKLSCQFGAYHLGLLPIHAFPIGTRHTVALRLYRRGFDTVAIPAWETPERVLWKPAPDRAAQEKAVDDLIGVASFDGLYDSVAAVPQIGFNFSFAGIPTVLETGAKSPAHRDALLFAAEEYEWLAMQVGLESAEKEDPVRARLLAKASRLTSLADGK